MKAGIGVLSDRRCPGRKIAVLGRMLELGSNSPALHRGVGTAAAKASIDCLITVGDEAGQIAEGAEEAGAAFQIIRAADVPEAEKILLEMLRPGDTVYLKASNAVHLSQITDFIRKEGPKKA
jgi:UDP-N-acetylmuramoyl-tripeptide--D-alanyl-D-alanine ligase